MPKPVVKWAKAQAPMAAKVAWHSDTWPDSRTSRPRERKRIKKVRALVKSVRSLPTSCGTKHSRTVNGTARPSWARPGIDHRGRMARTTVSRVCPLPRGVKSRTRNRTTNGMLAASPLSSVSWLKYLVRMAAATPMTRPPT